MRRHELVASLLECVRLTFLTLQCPETRQTGAIIAQSFSDEFSHILEGQTAALHLIRVACPENEGLTNTTLHQ